MKTLLIMPRSWSTRASYNISL